MLIRPALLLLLAAPQMTNKPPATTVDASDGPVYHSDGKLKFPERYREWIYLSSGIDMSYSASTNSSHSMFDNVFVNPSAYQSFLRTGTWPDKTMLVLELRGAESNTSINKRGHTQSVDVMGFEVHVKDKSIPGNWGFYDFEDKIKGTLFPRTADCYSCHEQHGAVDTTFVQFYPTLLAVAKAKGTLSPEYLKEVAVPAASK